jgi:hypothetical protein
MQAQLYSNSLLTLLPNIEGPPAARPALRPGCHDAEGASPRGSAVDW